MQANVYFRKSDLLEAELGDEIVALNADTGICFGFNEVASTVWRLLEQPRTEEQIRSSLEQQYDVEPGRCREEVAELLRGMVDQGIVGIRQEAR